MAQTVDRDGGNPPPATPPLTGVIADRYRIERELGAGGMATVYLAHDLRHDRPVAVKALRPELAEAVGVERFLSEITTTANLQHAHILGLIDSGRANGTVFYVMPYVDGESLRHRLAREGQLPVAEAVRIAIAVARALDYAHRRGIVHRDIKPENILLHEGQPLVADFGIALAVTRSSNDSRVTQHGVSLGTPQYMSPEQAMGERTLDGRTDIYALGCVLYEMLTGAPPFTGPNSQAVFAKLMTAQPEPVTTARRATPPNVAATTMTALSKLPADRFATAAEFAAALENPSYAGLAFGTPRRRSRRSFPYLRPAEAVAVVVLTVLAGVAIAGWRRAARQPDELTTRFEISIPDSEFSPQVALSADGLTAIWSAPSGYYARRLDSLGVRRLRDATPNAGALRALSPDGRNAVMSGRGALSVVPLAGGAPRSLASGARVAAWGADGYVYFAFAEPASQTRGLARIRAEGGAVDTLLKLDALVTGLTVLPHASGLIVGLNRNGAPELDAFDVRSRKLISLGVSGSSAQFVDPGWLIFARGTALWAGPFDAGRLAFSRPPASFLELQTASIAHVEASREVLMYVPLPEQSGAGVVVRTLSGATQPLANIPDTLRFAGFAVSPDGQRLAMQGAPVQNRPGPPQFNVYVYEIGSSRLTRLRSNDRDQSPDWLPNSRELSFVRVGTDTPATSTLMRRRWDGSSVPESLLTRPGGGRGSVLGPTAWLPNGQQVIMRVGASPPSGRGGPSGNLMRLSLSSGTKLDAVVATEYAESDPAVSPDGHLLAFTSDETGRVEVFMRRIDGDAMVRASLNGGTLPRFAHNGRELFYVSGDTLFSAAITARPELAAGAVKPVLVSRNIGLGYAVLPGDTSVIVAAVPRASTIVVWTHYASSLERLFAK